jgi:hypothetical protein
MLPADCWAEVIRRLKSYELMVNREMLAIYTRPGCDPFDHLCMSVANPELRMANYNNFAAFLRTTPPWGELESCIECFDLHDNQLAVAHVFKLSIGQSIPYNNYTFVCSMLGIIKATPIETFTSVVKEIGPDTTHSSIMRLLTHQLFREYKECVPYTTRVLEIWPELATYDNWVRYGQPYCLAHLFGPGPALIALINTWPEDTNDPLYHVVAQHLDMIPNTRDTWSWVANSVAVTEEYNIVRTFVDYINNDDVDVVLMPPPAHNLGMCIEHLIMRCTESQLVVRWRTIYPKK